MWGKGDQANEQDPSLQPITPGGGAPDLDGKSIGEQIDAAIGAFDAELAKLRQERERKGQEAAAIQRDINAIENQIAEMEKQQGNAFAHLLKSNPLIRKRLNPQSTGTSSRRRRTVSKAQIEQNRDRVLAALPADEFVHIAAVASRAELDMTLASEVCQHLRKQGMVAHNGKRGRESGWRRAA